MPYDEVGAAGIMVFVLVKDATERESMRAALSQAECLVVPLDSIAAAVSLLRNNAACNAMIVSTDVLENNPELVDQLLASKNPPPPVIVYGIDPFAKVVLHWLNRGAVDFLAKPFEPGSLIRAVESAAGRDGECRPVPRNADAIIGTSPVADWIEITSSSELEQFRRLQRFSDVLFASRWPEQVCEDLKMAVEEVGRNAVEWGNRFDPDKQVHVSYCMFDDRIVIKVQDEGDGFVPQEVPDPTADPLQTMRDRVGAGKRPGGYGVYLIQKLVDDIVYSEKGNIVLLIKYLPERKSHP